jgi:hypothetical protein
MSELHEKSVAFQLALLESERLRILILVGAIGAGLVLRTIRTIILHSREDFHLWLLTFDLLLLATDGFYEWANVQSEEFGSKRLEETVRASREKSSSDIISALYRAVVDFSGGTKQQDDLTAVIIKRS